jgi:hypothetical protein
MFKYLFKVTMQNSKVSYLNSKTSYKKDVCDCKKPALCGICWWSGVTKDPNTDIIPECSKCLEDMNKFLSLYGEHTTTKDQDKPIMMRSVCCPSCLWWDWFHTKRISYGVDVLYK